MLTKPETIEPLLVCPRCRSALVRDDTRLRCSSSACALARDPFPVTSGWPILVDFERSIVDRRRAVSSAVGVEYARSRINRLPGWLRRLLKPPNHAAKESVARLIELAPADRPLVLVVGGGTVGNGVEGLYETAEAEVIGFDVYASPLTQFVADAHQIPIEDGSVDAVVVQAVLEHVLDPSRVVAEIHRVLRSNGVVYAEVPFLQAVHAGAYDFTRYTASGLGYLFRDFEALGSPTVAGPGTTLLWSLEHVVRGLFRSATAGRLSRIAFFWLRSLDRLVPASYASDSANALGFLGRRLDHQAFDQRSIIEYYPGAQR